MTGSISSFFPARSTTCRLRPDPRFTDQRIYANYSEADYDSLQVFAHRRLSRGLDFTVAYTYSRLLDDNASDRNIFPRVPSVLNLGANATQFGIQGGGAQFVERPRKADRGLSDNDLTHNLTVSHVYELPFGVPAPIADPFVAIRRNALRGPAIATYDLSIIKRFRIGERALFGFEVNAFNVFNRTNFANPLANLTSFGTPNQLFGQIQMTRTPPRW
jgi:hypothetical protein